MIPAIISEESVKLALDSIISPVDYARYKSLQNLRIVDEFIHSEPDLLDSPFARAFALQAMLNNFIRGELLQARETFGVKTIEDAVTFKQIKQQIREDARTGRARAISWSWLYYRYFSNVSPLSQQEFCKLVHLDDRTIRRYQAIAITQLTNQISIAEWEAKIRQNTLNRIPPLPIVGHFGRQIQLFKAYYHFYLDNVTPLQITGSVGIGKSAFVSQLVHMLVQRGQVSEVHWLDMSSQNITQLQLSWDKIVRGIFTRLRSRNKFFREQRMVFVLDGLNPDIHEPFIRNFNYERQVLGNTFICQTTENPIRFKQPIAYLPLTDLPATDAFNLIYALLAFYKIRFKQKSIARIIWDESKGNPAAIHEAVARYMAESREQNVWIGNDNQMKLLKSSG